MSNKKDGGLFTHFSTTKSTPSVFLKGKVIKTELFFFLFLFFLYASVYSRNESRFRGHGDLNEHSNTTKTLFSWLMILARLN